MQYTTINLPKKQIELVTSIAEKNNISIEEYISFVLENDIEWVNSIKEARKDIQSGRTVTIEENEPATIAHILGKFEKSKK